MFQRLQDGEKDTKVNVNANVSTSTACLVEVHFGFLSILILKHWDLKLQGTWNRARKDERCAGCPYSDAPVQTGNKNGSRRVFTQEPTSETANAKRKSCKKRYRAKNTNVHCSMARLKRVPTSDLE